MLQHAARSMPRSSSGLGRRPFKAEITGSNPVRGTIPPFVISQLFRRSLACFLIWNARLLPV